MPDPSFPAFSTPVRGHAFAAVPPGEGALPQGTPLRPLREPGNPRDRHAVALWLSGKDGPWRVGYLERAVAARLAPKLDKGVAIRAELDGWLPEPGGRWLRPLVRISAAEQRLDGHESAGGQDPLHDRVVEAA